MFEEHIGHVQEVHKVWIWGFVSLPEADGADDVTEGKLDKVSHVDRAAIMGGKLSYEVGNLTCRKNKRVNEN